jgi:WD40 repeat protein
VVLVISNVVVQGEREFARRERDQKALALQEKETALQQERIALVKAREQEQLATTQKGIALEQEHLAHRNLYIAHMNLAQTHWENANVSRVEELLDLYRRVGPGQEDLRGWEWYYQERLCQSYLRTLRGHQSQVLSVAFGPDGARLATGSDDQMVKVWDVATGRELRTFQGKKDRVRSMAISPDGTRMATGSENNTVTLWDVVSGQELRTFQGKKQLTFPIFSLAFSPDGTRLVSGSLEVTVWDVASGQAIRTLDIPRMGHLYQTVGVAFSPNGVGCRHRPGAAHLPGIWSGLAG